MLNKSRTKHYNQTKIKAILLGIAIIVAVVLHVFPQFRETLSQYVSFIPPSSPITTISGDLDVHFIDIGQGDASLILTPEGNAMLIDTGTSENKTYLVEYIKSLSVTSLDYLVLTHPHADHIGGAAAVLDAFTVRHILMPDVVTDTSTFQNLLKKIETKGNEITIPRPGNTYSLGTTVITCLGPLTVYEELNNMSLVLRLDYGSTSFLFTGDAETQSETDMLAHFSESDFRADVLKLGHHGSSTSTSDHFLAAVSPAYAIACCGKNNDYGHPHREIVAMLQKKHIQLLRTYEAGSIVFSSNGEAVSLLRPATHS